MRQPFFPGLFSISKIFGLLLFWAVAPLALASSFSDPDGYVNDFANVIPADQNQQIASLLTELEQKTGAEVAVVTMDSLKGNDIESTSAYLFQQWGIGQKKKDNGVLVVAAIQDHKVRIEVGYGLESILPDGLAGSIIREDIVPAFKQGDYGGGFLAGTQAIAQIIAQADGVTLTGQAADDSSSANDNPYIVISLAIGFLVFLIGVMIWAIKHPSPTGGGYSGGHYVGGGFGGGGSGGGGFGGFSGGSSGGGGASGSW